MLLQIYKEPCKHPVQNHLFKWGDAQLKAIRELAQIFDAEAKIPNRDTLSTPPNFLTKKRTKLPRVEDYTTTPQRVDPD